jgi:sterol desaturase/sphingolipid hydroxylase (fatty acid hydroxylase superfamily)
MEVVLFVALFAAVMVVVERLVPGVEQPDVPWWAARVVGFNAAQVGIVWLGALTWDRWLPQWQLVDGAALGPVGGVVVGYVAMTFVFYWWHRARHEVPFLWRHLHQVHHSPARIEVLTSFYKHPLEILANAWISSSLLVVVLGLPAASAAAVVAVSGVAELVYHWNVRTPRWLGWIFQRPEMHRRHHERGWHRNNFSDLPAWDLLFGTFDNPRDTPRLCGFGDHRELQVLRLLRGETK